MVSEIYVDDATISLRRVTPTGIQTVVNRGPPAVLPGYEARSFVVISRSDLKVLVIATEVIT